MPIATTLDPHVNVSNQMYALADIIVSFKTHLPIDMRDTGRHAQGNPAQDDGWRDQTTHDPR